MTLTDFSRAQERIAARRRARESVAPTDTPSNVTNALGHLPLGSKLRGAGLQTWEAVRGREGTRPAFRVGQVDAELLDEELLELLKGQVGEGLKYFGVSQRPYHLSEISTHDTCSHILGTTGPPRLSWPFAPYSSRSASGTMMRLTARRFKISSTPTRGSRRRYVQPHRDGRRGCMGCSPWAANMHGANGRIGW